jgi:CDP-glucose 4,6-dehydratase
MAFADRYRGRRVLVTGHTGFKGAWLAEWLLALGARVTGVALPPPTRPALFEQLGLGDRLDHVIGDVRDGETLERIVRDVRPEHVFHLAAQALVRPSYDAPVDTYATNVMGTVHLLEAVRRAGRPCVVVAITTDKCYENTGGGHAYREDDPLGGHDPYSASKAAAEIAIAGYRRSFFSAPGSVVHVASARAGNVIGGGDWARDRIVPDCIRGLQAGEPIPVRNPSATRPWQHVLEPLSGYLWLAARLGESAAAGCPALRSAFNFGPPIASNRAVADLVGEVLKHWPGRWEDRSDPGAVHEAASLHLATGKADHLLGWRALWSFEQSVARTVTWYREAEAGAGAAAALTRRQIADYTADARTAGLPWAA